MEKQFMFYTLASGQVVAGTVYHMAQLSAKFQVWARETLGMSDLMSLACWHASEPDKARDHFGSYGAAKIYFTRGFAMLEGVQIPDLTEVGNEPLRFCVVEI
jgi:hypothetical protein